ncbi:MAG: TadE/TadG family type IV pilus assembly protein [Pseudomonadota bacterium]
MRMRANQKRLPRLLTRFGGGEGRKGSIAVEFALIFPLLILLGMAIADLIIYTRDVRRADHLNAKVAELAATHPAFDNAARASIQRALSIYNTQLNGRDLRVDIVSVEKTGGALREAFPTTNLHGGSTGISWRNYLSDDHFVDGEVAIVVSTRLVSNTITSLLVRLEQPYSVTTAVQPFYSRSYDYADGYVDHAYHNVQ